MARKPLLVAVDGPAASGKGTIARAIASHFELPHLDTGSIYRAVALALLRRGGDVGSEFAALRACDDIAGLAGDAELRTETVGSLASRISVYPAVRAALIQRQQDFAGRPGGAVLDGRDVGTVIMPHAGCKLFVTAATEVRAKRRLAELTERGLKVHLADILIDIRARDSRDAARQSAPLLKAADAMVLETSTMDRAEAIAAAIALVKSTL